MEFVMPSVIRADEVADSGHYKGDIPDIGPIFVFCVKKEGRVDGANIPARVKFKNLEMLHAISASIVDDAGVTLRSGPSIIVWCVSDVPGVRKSFERVFQSVIVSIGRDVSGEAVIRSVSELAELLRVQAVPSREIVQGLFSELCLINEARDPEAMIRQWHVTNRSKWDFTGLRHVVEVKSTVGSERTHRFELTQLSSAGDSGVADVAVVSCMLIQADNGITVADLRDLVCTRVSSRTLVAKVERIWLEVLGSQGHESSEYRFAYEPAVESFRLYWGESVPRPLVPLPLAISEVSFRADLRSVSAICEGSRVVRYVEELLNS